MQEHREAARLMEFLGEWLAERVRESGTRGVVFGLSGGIDSAVVCGLAARALGPEACLGVIMPIGNLSEDEELAHETAAVFGVRTCRPDLLPAFEALSSALREERDALRLEPATEAQALLASSNLKPRLRMIALYHMANLANLMVVGTGNAAELAVGYFTKHGDGGADLLPLGDLTKHEVRGLARELGVPERVIERPPSAGLWEGQTDEEEMGLTYGQIDAYLKRGNSGDPEADARLERLHAASAHKRAMPPIARPE
jgi:NAD+ synthase